MSEINFEKSVQSGKVIYDSSIERFTEICYMVALLGIFIYMFSYESFLEAGIYNLTSLIIPTLTLIFSSLLIYWYLRNDDFIREENLLYENNKIIIEKYLNQLIEQREWKFLENSHNLKILDIPLWQVPIGFSNKLYIIYDDEDLLLHFSSYGIFGLKFPVNYICNRNVEKKIIHKIRTKIKNAP